MLLPRAITGTKEGIFLDQDVWYKMKLFLNFDESIQYCGTDEKAILGKFIVPGEIDLKMKIFFYQINAATTNIKNTHEVTILANVRSASNSGEQVDEQQVLVDNHLG